MIGFYHAFIWAGVVFSALNSLGSIAEMTRYDHGPKAQGQIIIGHFTTSVFCALLATTVL